LRGGFFPGLRNDTSPAAEDSNTRLAVITAGRTQRLLYSSDTDFVPRDVLTSDAVMNIFGSPLEGSGGQLWQTEIDSDTLKREDWHRFSSPVWFSCDSTRIRKRTLVCSFCETETVRLTERSQKCGAVTCSRAGLSYSCSRRA